MNFEIFEIYVLKPFILHNLFFWIPSLLLSIYENIMDFFRIETRFFERKPNPISINKLYSVILGNMLVTFAFFWMVSFYTRSLVWDENLSLNLIYKIILTIVYEELFFYCFHHFLHTFLYEEIHKMHHAWITPNSFVALYSHPIEHILCNLLPIFLSAYLSELTWLWINIWLCFATLNAVIAHSGIISRFHVAHHYYYTGNYGVTGFTDIMMGSYRQ